MDTTFNAEATALTLTEAQRLAFEMMCDCQTPLVKGAWRDYSSIVEELGQTLGKMPKLYEQDGKGYDAVVYAHYFTGATDFFVTERDGDDMFGFAILNGDYEMSELGYLSLRELKGISSLNLDFHWEAVTLREALKEISPYYDDI